MFQETQNMTQTNTAEAHGTGINWRGEDVVADLLAGLRFRRPKGGPTEQRFIREYLDHQITDLKQDEIGNIYKIVGDDNPSVLWSCHTDSVHRIEGEQAVIVDGDWVRLPKGSKSNCLGADDMAGIWVMRKMIQAGVPGMYVFHFGEESGCIGSAWVAKNRPQYLRGIQAAIAFDRRGFSDVITHQMCGRSASDAFAESLCKLLPPGFAPSSHGVYTDTASYTEIVPECTNVSVGYFHEHSSEEKLYLPHIVTLAQKLCTLTKEDLDTLVIKRDPTVVDEDDWYGYGGYGTGSSRYYMSSSRRRDERSNGIYRGKYGGTYQHLGSAYDNDDTTDVSGGSEDNQDWTSSRTADGDPPWSDDIARIPATMEELLENYPRTVGRLLEAYGFTVEDLWDEIGKEYGKAHY